MGKNKNKKSGIPRLLELAGRKENIVGMGMYPFNSKCVFPINTLSGSI